MNLGLGIVLDTERKKNKSNSCPHGAYILVREKKTKLINLEIMSNNFYKGKEKGKESESLGMTEISAWEDLPEGVTVRRDLNEMRPSPQLCDDGGDGTFQASVRQEHTRRT